MIFIKFKICTWGCTRSRVNGPRRPKILKTDIFHKFEQSSVSINITKLNKNHRERNYM